MPIVYPWANRKRLDVVLAEFSPFEAPKAFADKTSAAYPQSKCDLTLGFIGHCLARFRIGGSNPGNCIHSPADFVFLKLGLSRLNGYIYKGTIFLDKGKPERL